MSVLARLLTLPSALLALSVSQALAAGVEVRDANMTAISAPIAFAPDGSWDGIDGSWSSFTLRVGTPEQSVRVLISFASYQTWVVLPAGCGAAENQTACASQRGQTFDNSTSSTWDPIGIYDISIEQDLGYVGNAEYGYETVGLGGAGDGGPTLQNTTVGAFAVLDFYLGVFGVNPKPTNFTNLTEGSPSYMTLLKEQEKIASLSAGYNAGAKYRDILGSLTLGGYDESRFTGNDVEFSFGADNERDIVVAIQDITTPAQLESNPQAVKLLPNPIYAYIDSTVPQIWLPLEACAAFESAFGLVYDNMTELYLVNDTLHQQLQQRNASITFMLGTGLDGGNTTQIELPYSAFDLEAQTSYQGLSNSSYYFPLRRAQNSSQYTLGRTFLQEAYLSVDWERQRFNVSQALWNQSATESLVAIPPFTTAQVSTSGSDDSSGIGSGAIAGIVVGVLAIVALIGCGLMWYFHRRSKKAAAREKALDEKHPPEPPVTPPGEGRGRIPNVFPKAELEGSAPSPLPTARTNSNSAHVTLLSSESAPRGSSNSHHVSSVHDHSGDNSSHSPTVSSHGEGTHSSIHSSTLFSTASAINVGVSGTSSIADPSSIAGGRSNHTSGTSWNEGEPAFPRPVYEMVGDMPTIKEKDGREFTEKEVLQHREKVYNGVDVIAMTPTSTESHDEPFQMATTPPIPPRAQRRLTPSQVVLSDAGTRLHRAFSFEGSAQE